MLCPSCHDEMQEERHRGVQLDLCSRCPGVWFDWGELQEYHAGEGSSGIDGIPGPGKRFEPTGDSTHVKCPRCERDILRTGTIGRHRVMRCTTCGGVFLPLPKHRDGTGQAARNGVINAAIRTFQELFTSRG